MGGIALDVEERRVESGEPVLRHLSSPLVRVPAEPYITRLVYADQILRPWLDAATALVPGIELFDAHTHTGSNDPDGFRCTPEQLIEGLDVADARRSRAVTERRTTA
jgi:hypothetical protein